MKSSRSWCVGAGTALLASLLTWGSVSPAIATPEEPSPPPPYFSASTTISDYKEPPVTPAVGETAVVRIKDGWVYVHRVSRSCTEHATIEDPYLWAGTDDWRYIASYFLFSRSAGCPAGGTYFRGFFQGNTNYQIAVKEMQVFPGSTGSINFNARCLTATYTTYQTHILKGAWMELAYSSTSIGYACRAW